MTTSSNEPAAKDLLARRLAVGSFVLSVVTGIGGIYFANWSAKVQQQAMDRASGKAKAQIAATGVKMNDSDFPAGKRLVHANNNGPFETILLDGVEDLKRLNIVLHLKNVGDETIEAIRIETRTAAAKILQMPNVDPPKEVSHVIVKQANVLDYALNDKLQPSGTAHISILRNVLEQILDSQDPKHVNFNQSATFQINCYAKIVGGTSFDAADNPSLAYVTVSWKPAGFGEEARKQLGDFLAVPVIRNPKK